MELLSGIPRTLWYRTGCDRQLVKEVTRTRECTSYPKVDDQACHRRELWGYVVIEVPARRCPTAWSVWL